MSQRWRYRSDTPFVLHSPLLAGVRYLGDWLRIDAQILEIAAGYAWDGCSPALRLPGGIWIGTPDGPLGADGRPVAWRASLVHDALCQFRDEIVGLSKEASVRIFASLLAVDAAPLLMQRLYPLGVRLFGPQDWRVGCNEAAYNRTP